MNEDQILGMLLLTGLAVAAGLWVRTLRRALKSSHARNRLGFGFIGVLLAIIAGK